MATLREVKGRINAVKDIKKIAQTMEKISTAKIKKNEKRLKELSSYRRELYKVTNKLLTDIKVSGGEINNKLLIGGDEGGKELLLIVSSNRGLCGAYNQNVLSAGQKEYARLRSSGGVINYMLGKKGVSAFKYRKIPLEKMLLDIDDNVSYELVSNLGDELLDLYISGVVKRVVLVYTKYYGSTKQKPVVEQLLPMEEERDTSKGDDAKGRMHANYLSEPDKENLLNSLLPLKTKIKLYNMVLETNLSEQVSRRVAMKQASDSASEIIRDLSLEYNRARQSKITNEIIEIVGAARALHR